MRGDIQHIFIVNNTKLAYICIEFISRIIEWHDVKSITRAAISSFKCISDKNRREKTKPICGK